MFPRWTYALVGALFAAIALFGTVATASAGEDTEAASATASSHRLPNIDPSLLAVDHPAYAVLQNLLESDLLPQRAADVLRRVSDAHADRVASGFACDRIAATDLASDAGTTLRERCRTALGDGANVFALCRRAMNAGDVDPSIIERCRALLADHSDRNEGGEVNRDSLAEACRRVAQSDNAELVKRCRNAFVGDDHGNDGSLAEACRRLAQSDIVNEELAKRCRNAFYGDDHDANPGAVCRRLAQSDAANEELAKRCRNLSDGHDGPRTDLEGRNRPRPDGERPTDLRERFDAQRVAPRTAVR